MKRIFHLVIISVLFAGAAYAQKTTEVIKHTYYTTTYDKSLHYPVLVEWWDYTERCGCDNPIPRKDKFAPDPKDVKNTSLQKGYNKINKDQKEKGEKGYDRGHMCPAADNQCMGDEAQAECFYFSNMAPQTHALNAGDWKSLETRTRVLCLGDTKKHIAANDSIHIWAGSVGAAQTDDMITVPEKCWKVIYIKKQKKYEAYIFDNTFDKPQGLAHWKSTVAEVEKLTGFKFKK